MSNFLAIATVTATLQRTLQASVQIDVDGARVTTLRPNSIGSATPETGVNLFLYEVAPNYIWNSNGSVRRPKGTLVKKSQLGLNLHYMLTCYGNEVDLEPQRLLGSVVRTFQDKAVLTQQMIQDTIADPTFTFLASSDLADQLELLKISPLNLSLEDLSKVWSVFFQTPYALSIAYECTVVLIEGDEAGQRALPVRRTQAHVTPYQPVIEQIRVVEDELSRLWRTPEQNPLILAGSTLMIRGQRLYADRIVVKIGDAKLRPDEASETQLSLPLTTLVSGTLRAGVQTLQVLHPDQHVSSNVMPVVVRPTIKAVDVSGLEGTDEEPRSAEVSVQVNFSVEKTQRVALLLYELSSEQPKSYTFDVAARSADSHLITFPVKDVKPAEYLVRMQVDGAESLLSIDTDSESPTFQQYIGPKVLID